MSKASQGAKVLEIVSIEGELEEVENLTAFLNYAAVEMAGGTTLEKESMGLQYCFFHLEKKVEQARGRLYQLRLAEGEIS